MSRVIKVDWADLISVEEEFLSQAMDVKTINEDLTKQIEALKECWTGIDADNFSINSKNINSVLTKEVNHLAEWCEYIKKSSGKYNRTVEEGLASLKKTEDYYE